MAIDYSLLRTEIALAVVGLAVFTIGLLGSRSLKQHLGTLTVLGLLVVLALTVQGWAVNAQLLGGSYLIDPFSAFFKIVCLLAAVLVIVGSMRYVRNHIVYGMEFYSTLVFATLGMSIMASAGDFITLYLGLELMTISFVVLAAFRFAENKSLEAGIKYLLLAGISSAVVLYGLSLIYGATGTILIAQAGQHELTAANATLLIMGLAMLIGGLSFKIAAVPFHMWSPDVYEGSPTPVTAFLAIGSKAASFALIIRLLISGLPALAAQWTVVFAVLAAISMVVGNLAAIPQTNIKRLLAYSSIAQAGYIMVGLVTAGEAGVKGILFYAMIYVFATAGAFTVVAAVYDKIKSDNIAHYAGLIQRAPLAAVVMLVCLLSMAGIPPLAGFAGKFYLFKSAVEGYMWLVMLGLVMSMVSVYYYLRVVLVMFGKEPSDPAPLRLGSMATATLLVALTATLALGIYPGPLAELATTAAQSFFGP